MRDCSFVSCTYGIEGYFSTLTLSSVVFCDVVTNVNNLGGTVSSTNVTSLDGSDDYDGDLISNFDELIRWLSDPLVANSQVGTLSDGRYFLTAQFNGETKAKLTGIEVVGSQLRLKLEGAVTGEPYDIFFTSDLSQSWILHYSGPAENDATGPVRYYLVNNPNTQTAFFEGGIAIDSDMDGLTDGYEMSVSKTNPADPDSDSAYAPGTGNMGVADGDKDYDGDGLSTSFEYALRSAPFSAQSTTDSDSDGLPNWFELFITNGASTTTATQDGDANGSGWSNWMEFYILKSSPLAPPEKSLSDLSSGTAFATTYEAVINPTQIQVNPFELGSDALGAAVGGLSQNLFNGIVTDTYTDPQGNTVFRMQASSMFNEAAPASAWSKLSDYTSELGIFDSTILAWTSSQMSQLCQLDYNTLYGLSSDQLDKIRHYDAARIGARWKKVQEISAIPGDSIGKEMRIRKLHDEIHTISTRLKSIERKAASGTGWMRTLPVLGGIFYVYSTAATFPSTEIANLRQAMFDLAGSITGSDQAEIDLDIWDVAQACEQVAPAGGATFNYVWNWLSY